MMDLRKTLSLCLALLLVAGFAGTSSAQIADPTGVWIRVTAPDSGKYAKIADTVRVSVITFKARLDSIFLAVVSDTSATLADARTAIASGSAGTPATQVGPAGNTGTSKKHTTKVILAAVVDSSASFKTASDRDTFKFKFGIAPGDTEFTTASELNIKAFVSKKDDASFQALKNAQTEFVIGSGPFAATKVGDRKQFSVDGKRPVSTSVFTSVSVDTIGHSHTPSAAVSSGASWKLNDKVIIKLGIDIGSAADANAINAKVGLVDSKTAHRSAGLDSALYTATFTNIFVTEARDTSTAVAGRFKDNQRIVTVAYLTDAAGNLSANIANAALPVPLTSSVVYLMDSTAPVIAPTTPHPDSAVKRFTKVQSTNLSLRSTTNGAVATTTINATPLKFRVSEKTSFLEAELGSVRDTLSSATFPAATTGAGTAVTLTKANGTAAGGTSLTLKVNARDSVGNASTMTVSGATYDAVAPSVTNQFPQQGNAPKNASNSNKPTVNNTTKNPVIRINETLDSLSVRYVQVGVSPPNAALQGFSPGNTILSQVGTDISATVNDTLLDGQQYTLELVLIDLAKNASKTGPDTLTFTKNFQNPTADSFLVKVKSGAAHGDSVIAGQQFQLTLTAIDSQLTRTNSATVAAVTYNGTSRLRIGVAQADQGKLAGIAFGGTGVSIAATDTGKGVATLNTGGWVVGTRDLFLTSKWAIDSLTVWVENTTTTGETTVVNFKGQKSKSTIDAAEMTQYVVKAWSGSPATEVTGVQGPFTVSVMAADQYGNASTKTRMIATGGTTVALTDSSSLLDSRINKLNVLKELFVEFGSNLGDAQVPSGPQAIGAGSATFTAVAPNRAGTDLWITVRTFNQGADTSGVKNSQTKHLVATGSVGALSFSGVDGPPPVNPQAPARPDTLIVQNYRGANGTGDQGGYVSVAFKNSADHATVSRYRVYREITVSTSLVDGKLVIVTTTPLPKKWVSWAVLDASPVVGGEAVTRAVVPTLDNVATRWAVSAERGGLSSENKVAGKRVFTKESVQQIVQLLGVDADRVQSFDELSKQFTVPQDYVKSILGDQKNLVFAALDVDVNELLSNSSTVPQSIRTAGGEVLSSAQTISATAVAGLDDLPPAAVTEAAGAKTTEGVSITWKASADDKTVGFMSYRGYAIPIPGVDHYEVLRGTTEANLTSIATLGAGSTSFVDTNLPQGATSLIYRVNGFDLDNVTAGLNIPVTLTTGRVKYATSDGLPVYLVREGGSLEQDFEDFVAFAQSYDKVAGEVGFNFQADTNDDGVIDFSDFVRFAQSYGRVAVAPAGKRVIAPSLPGVNDNTEMSLNLGSERVLVGQTISVNVSLANTQSLEAFGFVLNYDADKFEFVSAVPAENDLLKSTGGETPLFSNWPEAGQVTIANAIINGTAVSGNGDVVTLTFKVLREFEDNARFEIAQGVVFDPNQLSNPAVTLGALSVESTPTEFALNQNFPNPFNPETTIKYQLAESAPVQLRIYNIVGQVVRTLVSEQQAAGRYQIRWNGTDDRGMAVSSGIYFYQVSAGKFQDVKRLMLLK
ncbi:MAG: T9SS type A sorting domain-containing protein [bacterium]|nr:T9SS type A sorting domain-containing protein [bacterium]